MVEFMVLSAPRSASTWAANWLTTEKTLCLHDPVLEHTPEEFDSIDSDRVLGVACTAVCLAPDFVNAHPARKVILHRPRAQIDASLMAIGLSPLSQSWDHALARINGEHVAYTDLFKPSFACGIYEFLTHQLFDEARHRELIKMHIDPEFDRVPVSRNRVRAWRQRIELAMV